MKPDTQKQSAGGVDIRSLVPKLHLVDEDCLAAAAEQPSLYEKSARYLVTTMRAVANADLLRDKTRAERSIAFRDEVVDGKKLTVGALEALLDLDPALERAQTFLSRCKENHKYASELCESFKQRGQMVKILADARAREMSAGFIARDAENFSKDLHSVLSQKYK